MIEGPVPVQGLLDGRFLQETSHGYAFQHDLVRAACYQSQSAAALQRWHARGGQVLRQAGADAATLAWHFEQGAVWETAVHYHRRAAERALHLADVTTAEMHCGQALKLLAKTVDSSQKLPLNCLDLRIRQKLAWADTSLEEAQALVVQARTENDLDSLLQALLLLLNYLMSQGHLD